MQNIFHTYIINYMFLTPDNLYDDFVKYFENKFTRFDSTIYLIVKCKKPRWIDGSIKFYRDYKLGAQIETDGKIHNVVIDMADFWYNIPEMKGYFPDKRSMADYSMSRINRLPWKLLPRDICYKFLSSFDSISNEGKLLKINCEIMKNLNQNKRSLTDIFLYQAINYFNLPQPKLDIIYIGSSLKNTFYRLQKHEKWGWIQAQKDPDEDILVYFCEIEGAQVHVGSPIITRKDHGLSRKDETLITEMVLINYFKPKKYNNKHVDREVVHSERIKKKLIAQGFNQVCVEMVLNGNIAKLGSQHIQVYGHHSIQYNIA